VPEGPRATAKIRGADLLVLVVLQNHYGHQKKKEVPTGPADRRVAESFLKIPGFPSTSWIKPNQTKLEVQKEPLGTRRILANSSQLRGRRGM
jgi:hypothetical protein